MAYVGDVDNAWATCFLEAGEFNMRNDVLSIIAPLHVHVSQPSGTCNLPCKAVRRGSCLRQSVPNKANLRVSLCSLSRYRS